MKFRLAKKILLSPNIHRGSTEDRAWKVAFKKMLGRSLKRIGVI